jgi:uncharacterized cupin superfamily protein
MTNVDRLSGISDGLGRKAPVRVATTANITLSGLQTIDGITVAEDDRVLVKSQTTSSQNGIYNASTGTWTRALDFDGSRDVVTGTSVLVASGSSNALTEWVVTASDPITIDTTSLTFGQTTIPTTFNGATSIEADVASATTTDIGAASSMKVRVTGTTTVVSFGTTINVLRLVRFADILTLTHNGTSLILPGAANITTAAGDTAIFASDASGNWRCYDYERASGAPSVPGQGLTEVTVASATTTNIGTAASDRVLISGTTTITSLGTSVNKIRFVRFSGILTLTHNATTLILPGAANITTANGDTAVFSSDGSGNWRCYSYQRATGGSVVSSSIPSDTITLAMIRDESNGGISAGMKTLLGIPSAFGLYAGCNAGSYDSSHMYFNPGTFANSSGDGFYAFNSPVQVSTGTTGINVGVPVDGSFSTLIGGVAEGGPPTSPTDLNFYAYSRNSDNAVAIMASSFTTYGGVAPYTPSGWTLQRKMHFNCIYATGRGSNWNGIPDFFQEIDNSKTILTGADSSSNFRILNAGSSTSFALVSASTFFGDAARQVVLFAKVTSSGTAGTAYLRVPGVGSGFEVGEVSSTGIAYHFVPYKLDSSRNVEYKVTGGALLSLYACAYTFDEPT